MAGFHCPSPTCDFQVAIGSGLTDALTIVAEREQGDTRFNVWVSGGQLREPVLVHTCGDATHEPWPPDRPHGLGTA